MDPLDLVRSVAHGSVCLACNDTVVYVDPYHMEEDLHDADLVVITHGHADHYSPEDIKKVMKDDTCFATTEEISRRLQVEIGINDDYISELSCEAPTAVFECGVMVTPVIAENERHNIRSGFGAVVELEGVKVYFSGDTDVLAEGAACDILFVCCDGVYNMPGVEKDILNGVLAMDDKPGLVIPYHYGEAEVPGSGQNGARVVAALTAAGIPAKEWQD